MKSTPIRLFFVIIFLTIFAGLLSLPEEYHLKFSVGPIHIDRIINPPTIEYDKFGISWKKQFKTHLGLDLSGGTHIVLEADMKDIRAEDRVNALESAREVIDRRVNFYGVSEPIVQSSRVNDLYRIIVELPGVSNMDQAVETIGQTAKLEFREFKDEKDATPGAFVIPFMENTNPVGITGKELQTASLEFSQQTSEPQVSLEFTPEGGKKFAEVTKKLIGKPLAIFLDSSPLTWPRVNTEISDGKAVIIGSFTRDQAKTLSLQLRAGSLPVPVSIIEKKTIGATLGQESVAKSIRAGLVGLVIVLVFMILQYGYLGFLADVALIVYGLISFSIFRAIPITLTLPGIAGFILSVGMAVDSNILIFERYKEELRHGRPWHVAMELGFGKAWDSIRDANITTIITCLILYNPGGWAFLPSSGLVRGFALTLLVGVIVSLFTGIVVTRTLIRVLYRKGRKV